MPRLITAQEIKAGNRYRIVQKFYSGTEVVTTGVASSDSEDEYVFIASTGRLNLHPYVGMPSVEIWEV